MKKLTYTLILAFGMTTILPAQELGLHFMDKVFNSNMTNPANMSDFKVNIGLFSGYSNFSNSFTYRDAIQDINGQNVLDLDRVVNGLGTHSELIQDNAVQTLSLGISVKDWNFSFHHNVRNSNQFNIPRELLEFAWEGNAQFVGQTINIAPQFNMLAYNEIGIGVARKFNKLTVGVRLKKLNGIANFATENEMIMITTDEDTYDMNIESDVMINGASAIEFGGFEQLDFDMDNFSFGDVLKSNKGFGFDIGLNYQLNEKLQLSFSMLDIGSIDWTDNAYNYQSKGQYLYSGFDAAEALSGDDDTFDETLDELENTLEFTETTNSFSSKLPTRTYISANYRISQLFGVGALFMNERKLATGDFAAGFALNGSLYLGNKTALGLTYSMRNGEFGNIGFHAATSAFGLQLFAVADNILPVLDPLNNKNVDLRFGLNVAFAQRYDSMTKKKKEKYSEKIEGKIEHEEDKAIARDKKRRKRDLKKRLRKNDTQTN